ncbi:hypothetical protein VCRA2120O333_10506 [Vibrio crassostreae]|nr:hypothetical protein VCRA2111O408_40149 [Vibrio crassostreae]CAK3390279.1 hypothetical protein VCRA2127O344_30290 [Vibrio crassostreae]CAK3408338.1 hypothetical protein VCRA2123O443_40194 [Vibrio crassostreae]CAK3544797.1 hypothetical protein VCRA2121O436_50129 [Vibrio crassostreae]CAK3803221.1 hypothetical protein VCRA2120O333_10506 [Vibrio crassostreae]
MQFCHYSLMLNKQSSPLKGIASPEMNFNLQLIDVAGGCILQPD